MKISKIYYVLSLMLLAFATVSCSDDKEKDINEIIVNQLSDGLKDVCLEWDTDASTVENKMSRYDNVHSDSETMTFANKDRSTIITYEFDSNGLVAAMVAFNNTMDEEVVSSKLKGYDYIGRLDGNAIYKNDANHTICNFYTTQFDDTEYSVVGFTPSSSTNYDQYEPIYVSLDEISDITASTAIVKATLSGDVKPTIVGVFISEDENFSSKKSISGSSSNGVITVNMKNLTHDTKYWYYAYAIVDNITHKSNTSSFESEHMDTYEVGDIYPKTGTPEGVVFYTSEGGIHGKIVSFKNEYGIKWDSNGFFSQKAGCNNTSDGSKNSMPLSTSPAANWIKNNLGSEWYCPARGELVSLGKVASSVNATMSQNGYSPIAGFFWSSTEYSSNNAYIVCVASNTYMGYNTGWYGYNTKDEPNSILGIKKF